MTLTRRTILTGALAGLGLAALPGRRARAALASPRLVFVFLRGGADALNLLPPAGNAGAVLASLRPTISVAGALPLGASTDVLVHPALAPLLAPDIVSNLGVVLHAGSMADTRSHFDQMYRIETGDSSGATPTGMLTRAASALGLRPIAAGRVAPNSLLGSDPVVLSDPARLQPGYSDTNLKPGWSRAQRLAMYQGTAAEVGDPRISAVAGKTLADGNALATQLAGETLATLTANHGYVASSVFGQRLAMAARLCTTTLDPRLITLDGDQFWDTHGAQLPNDATAWRGLYVSARDLGTNLAAFKRDLVARGQWASTVVVVMSEFGRTVRENGSAGTDHGRAGAMLLMGGPVRGFADPGYLGVRRWTLPASPDGSTALQVTHDYRVVLGEIFERHLGMPRATASSIFLGQAALSAPLGVLR